MYTLADERVMYVPPVVRTKLVDLGIQPREPFTICKAERQEGNRRFIEYQVNKESDSNDRPASETPPVDGKTNAGTPKHRMDMPLFRPCSRRSRRALMRRSLRSSTRPREGLLGALRKRRLARHGAQPVHPARER